MVHIIPKHEIYRLSRIRGIINFDAWKLQLEDAEARIDTQLKELVEEAWYACLPTWLELGRVNDLAPVLRTPKYWQSYATKLGYAFVERYRNDYQFLIDMLNVMPSNSYEYLCAYDLLEMIPFEFYTLDLPIPNQLFSLELPAPSVVLKQLSWNKRYFGLTSIGEFIRLSHVIEYVED